MSADNHNNKNQVIYVDKETANNIAVGQMASKMLSFSIASTFICFAILYQTIQGTNYWLSKDIGYWVYVVVPGSILLCLLLALVGLVSALTIKEIPTKLFYGGLATYFLNMHRPIIVNNALQDEAVYLFFGVSVFMFLVEKIPKKEILLVGALVGLGHPFVFYFWDSIVGFLKAAGWM